MGIQVRCAQKSSRGALANFSVRFCECFDGQHTRVVEHVDAFGVVLRGVMLSWPNAAIGITAMSTHAAICNPAGERAGYERQATSRHVSHTLPPVAMCHKGRRDSRADGHLRGLCWSSGPHQSAHLVFLGRSKSTNPRTGNFVKAARDP